MHFITNVMAIKSLSGCKIDKNLKHIKISRIIFKEYPTEIHYKPAQTSDREKAPHPRCEDAVPSCLPLVLGTNAFTTSR